MIIIGPKWFNMGPKYPKILKFPKWVNTILDKYSFIWIYLKKFGQINSFAKIFVNFFLGQIYSDIHSSNIYGNEYTRIFICPKKSYLSHTGPRVFRFQKLQEHFFLLLAKKFSEIKFWTLPASPAYIINNQGKILVSKGAQSERREHL